MFQIKNLSVQFRQKNHGLFRKEKLHTVLDDITINIQGQGITCLMGESGSGKSTLIKVLAGLIEANSGIFKYENFKSDGNHSEWIEYRKKIGFVFQHSHYSLNPYITIETSLKEIQILRDKKVNIEKIQEILIAIKLSEDVLAKYPAELSGGQKQRVMIGKALLWRPQFYLLDEPVSALDVSIQAEILNLIVEIQEQNNVGILMVTHDLAVAQQVADSLLIMQDGKILVK